GQIAENTTGIRLEPSGNDGHGTFTGVTINHNSTGISVGALTNGMTFSGCLINSSPHVFTGNKGLIDFVGCALQPIAFTFDNALVRFADCKFDTRVFAGATYANNPQVTYKDCVDDLGDVPSFIQTRVQSAFTFAADADQTLTKSQSVSETLVI